MAKKKGLSKKEMKLLEHDFLRYRPGQGVFLNFTKKDMLSILEHEVEFQKSIVPKKRVTEETSPEINKQINLAEDKRVTEVLANFDSALQNRFPDIALHPTEKDLEEYKALPPVPYVPYTPDTEVVVELEIPKKFSSHRNIINSAIKELYAVFDCDVSTQLEFQNERIKLRNEFIRELELSPDGNILKSFGRAILNHYHSQHEDYGNKT